jgi:hypothetical protein
MVLVVDKVYTLGIQQLLEIVLVFGGLQCGFHTSVDDSLKVVNTDQSKANKKIIKIIS